MKNARTIALHRVEIPIPCTASWEAMQGDERVRHCASCNKNVFNLSAMAEDEAADLLAGNADGHLCVRFYRRADGTVLTSDCGGRATSARAPGWSRLAGATALALSAAACGAGDKAPVKVAAATPVWVNIAPQQPALMGDIAMPPTGLMGMPAMPLDAPRALPPAEPVEPVGPAEPADPADARDAVEPVALMGAPPPPPPPDDAPRQ